MVCHGFEKCSLANRTYLLALSVSPIKAVMFIYLQLFGHHPGKAGAVRPAQWRSFLGGLRILVISRVIEE